MGLRASGTIAFTSQYIFKTIIGNNILNFYPGFTNESVLLIGLKSLNSGFKDNCTVHPMTYIRLITYVLRVFYRSPLESIFFHRLRNRLHSCKCLLLSNKAFHWFDLTTLCNSAYKSRPKVKTFYFARPHVMAICTKSQRVLDNFTILLKIDALHGKTILTCLQNFYTEFIYFIKSNQGKGLLLTNC